MTIETLTVIDTVLLSADQLYITFDSIPQTYKNLVLRMRLHSAETGTTGTIRAGYMFYNDDNVSTNYRSQYTFVNSVINSDVRGSGAPEMYYPTNRGGSYTDIYSVGETRMKILNYTNTTFWKYGIQRFMISTEVESVNYMGDFHLTWYDTSAITKIQLRAYGYNWYRGSWAQLLGSN